MRVSKEKAAENRDALLRSASTLFRQRGIDAVGVAEVAKAAGLTHGALYGHFKSKDALAASAFSYGFQKNMESAEGSAPDVHRSFDANLDHLFSIDARDNMAGGCPMTASGSEIARQSDEVSARFAEVFETVVTMLEESLSESRPLPARRRIAVATLAAQIGAVVVARAVAKADASLSEEVLEATRATIHDAIRQ